jgi:hypothetical protein
VGDSRVRLDLLADGAAAQEKAVQVLVALAEEDLVRLEVEPAEDAQARLVEVAPDGGVGRAGISTRSAATWESLGDI